MGVRGKKNFLGIGEYASRESNPGLVQVLCAIVATWSSRDQGESQATSGIHNWCTKSSYPLFRGVSWPGGGEGCWGRGGLLRFPNHFGGAQIRFNNPGLEPSRQVPELELACEDGPNE